MLLSVFLFWFSIVPWSYFLNRFLIPKYKNTTLYTSLIFGIWVIIILVFFFDYISIKPVIVVIALYSCIWAFYDGTKYKKLIAPILLVAASCLAEVPIDLFLFKYLNIKFNEIFSNSAFLISQVIANFNIFIICYLFLKVKGESIIILIKHPTLLVSISINFFCTTISISQLQVMEMIQVPLENRLLYGFIMLFILIITDIYFILFFKKIYCGLKISLSMKKIEHEYMCVLDEYIDVNSKMYRFIKHDITNQLLQYNQVGSEKNETSSKIL